MKYKIFLLSLFSILTGCGGGGSDSSSPSNVTASSLRDASSSVVSVVSSAAASSLAEKVANKPPTANAGADVEVYAGQIISIMGAGFDSDGKVVAFSWEQISGASLGLTALGASQLKLTAPSVVEDTSLEFKLSVTDDKGAIASDVMRLTIKKIPVVGQISGRIIDIGKGTVISGAEVTLGDKTVLSTASGLFTLTEIPLASNRLKLDIKKEGFVHQQRIFNRNDFLIVESLDVSLVPVGEKVVIDPDFDNILETPDKKVTISILADSVARPDGEPLKGSVTASLTYIDPSISRVAMPGDYVAVGAGDTTDILESFGAFEFLLNDSDGAALKLIAPVTFEIKPVVLSPANLPMSSPTYLFDYSLGKWVGQSTVATQSFSAQGKVFQGSTSFPGTFNIDRPTGKALVSGCVTDESGFPIASARVTLSSRAQISASNMLTDINGNWSVWVSSPGQVVVSAQVGTQRTQSLTIAAVDTGVKVSQCLVAVTPAATIELTWGKKPVFVNPVLSLASIAYGSFEVPSLADDTWQIAPFARAESFDLWASIPTKLSIKKFVDGVYTFNAIFSGSDDTVPVSDVMPYVLLTVDGVTSEVRAPATVYNNNAKWEALKITVSGGKYKLESSNTWTNFAAE